MAAILELDAQLRKIVDLAVKNDSDIARFVVNRLTAAGEIDDARAGERQKQLRAA